MTLFFSWATSPGALGNTTVRLAKVVLTQAAEKGAFATSELPMDDPTGIIVPDALLPVSVSETACSVPYVFRGYAADRDLARGDGDSLLLSSARRWNGKVLDTNAVFNFDVLHGSGANRPSESCNARLAWLLSTNFGTLIADYGAVYTAPAVVSAADYRGQFPADVMNDLSERSGYNYFSYNDAATGGKALAFFPDLTFTGLDSTLRFTNVFADVDGATTFSAKAEMNRDPSQKYNGILLEWAGGQLYKTSGSTGVRQATVSKPNITTLAHAIAYADNWLDDHATEQDILTVTSEVPASVVNLIAAGNRTQVKFTHLDGYTSYTWIRCTSLTRAQDKDTDQRYTLTMTLKNPRATHGSGGTPGSGPPAPVPVPIPFPGGGIDCGTIVQSKPFAAYGSPLAFTSAPTVGNTVVFASLYSNGGGVHTPAFTPSFTLIDSFAPFDTLNTNYGLSLHYRVVTGGDTGSYAFTNAGQRAEAMVEIAGIGALTGSARIESTVDSEATAILQAADGEASSFIVSLFCDTRNSPDQGDYFEVLPPTVQITRWDNEGDLGTQIPPIGFFGYQQSGSGVTPQVTLHTIPPFFGANPLNWGAITASFAADCGEATPAYGQDIPWACQSGNGTTTTFITEFPYIAGSLEVQVDGLPILNGLTETSPTAGTFTLDFAPLGASGDSAAEQVCYRYRAGTT